ncbi:hypothetical protein E2P81_ATG02495 [Venturia nashicola]|uniref:DAPG hydrolase PhiG domain-containing protein n=1 Tax=Venturia nashicola TaxID=86259 RepID=A0A4Z1PAR6_9PEZI|nr:hypothetical protein E6O75_ATG02554 [Venturia nashicola]TLD36713.1 hypothetical protein E2P81_ATG02495 [Venturia nashicola]
MNISIPAYQNPVTGIYPLVLKEAKTLLTNPYLPMEAGYALNSDGMYHVAGHTYMKDVTGPMIDWWFGYVTNTDQYKQWHPKDHVFSSWSGPHGNSTYIGGNHLVHEYIGGQLTFLRIQFRDPATYFGENYKALFTAANVSTAVCARVGLWEGAEKGIQALDIGHVIHLVHNEFDGVRMRSRFWLGDMDAVKEPAQRATSIPPDLAPGLTKHTSEEMAILGTFLPDLYKREMAKGPKRRDAVEVLPWSVDDS